MVAGEASTPIIHWYGSHGSIWSRLIEPHPGILDPEEKRRARLLTAAMLVWLPISIGLVLAASFTRVNISGPIFQSFTLVFIPVLVLYGMAYVVSRTQYFDIGAYTVVTATEVAVWLVIALVVGNPYTALIASMLVLGVLLAAVFLSIEAVIGIAIVNLGGTLLLPFIAAIDATEMSILYTLQAVAYPFIVTAAWIRLHDLSRIETQALEMETVLDSIPDVVFAVDHDMAIMGANRAARSRFRHWFGNVLQRGTRLDELDTIPERVKELLSDAFTRAEVEGKIVFELNQYPTENGAKDFEFVINSLRNHHGDNEGYVVFVSDHTERNVAIDLERKAFKQSMEINKLEDINRFKTALLNTASHELRTPLTPIRVQLMVLRNSLGEVDPEAPQSKAITILERNILRMDRLVSDILDVARIESDQLKLNVTPVDFYDLVRHEVESYRHVAKKQGATISLEGGEGELWIQADGDRLGQVLVNLLSNAMKFVSDGHITVSCEQTDGHIRVAVKDDGVGMDPLAVGKLFQPFSQVHDERAEARGGSGLGLYICRGIIESHQGHIRAESDGIGKGSTFTFEIPYIPLEDEENGEGDESA